MSYMITRRIDGASFEEVEARTQEVLSAKGFGVLTEIDVRATMKKIDRDMEAYLILGACNPKMAWEAIGLEPQIGAMLPGNAILRQIGEGAEVSAVNPVASMSAIDNAELKAVAGDVRALLAGALDAI